MNSVVIATKRGIMDFQFLPVFQGLTEQELHDLEQIGAIRRQKFNKHVTVFHVGDLVHEIGIVLEGSVLIENNDLWGNKSILSRVEKGQVFAESYAFHEVPLMVDAIADEDSLILFLDVQQLMEEQNAQATWYCKMLKNLLLISTKKNRNLSNRIFCTTSKTVRGRLAAFFSEQAAKTGSNTFDIPFNRQQMADYLNLDRSALSKELGKMREEGLLTFRKNHFSIKGF